MLINLMKTKFLYKSENLWVLAYYRQINISKKRLLLPWWVTFMHLIMKDEDLFCDKSLNFLQESINSVVTKM